MSLVLQQRPRAYHFGSNRTLHSSQTEEAGTHFYKAPELAEGPAKSVYTDKSDVYSFGIIFFEMNYPLKTVMERNDVLKKLRSKNMQIPYDLRPAQKEVTFSIFKFTFFFHFSLKMPIFLFIFRY